MRRSFLDTQGFDNIHRHVVTNIKNIRQHPLIIKSTELLKELPALVTAQLIESSFLTQSQPTAKVLIVSIEITESIPPSCPSPTFASFLASLFASFSDFDFLAFLSALRNLFLYPYSPSYHLRFVAAMMTMLRVCFSSFLRRYVWKIELAGRAIIFLLLI